ncbi:MAG TPA: polysaccharide deacetylase family protein, partial [Candidatus Elarobacter sp.]|nr:polysaccharide deacetylase family protein [Candidatus Elarobacter sp.]
MAATDQHPRDFVGYGARPPDPKWPNGARIAVQIVMNYEEGSEYAIGDGDPASETYLTEVPGATLGPGKRDLIVESVYEYGSRAGFWRLMRMFGERDIPITVFGAALALERNPDAAVAIRDAGYEVCSHGWRWIGFQDMDEDEEREQMRRAVASIERTTGTRPYGWYCRYAPSINTRRLVVEEGGFLYDSDAYNDDLPYWTRVGGKPHLVIPYTLDNNDMKFSVAPGFTSGEGFFRYLKDAFDVLYREGARAPKMMSVGLHTRLAGRPGRAAA